MKSISLNVPLLLPKYGRNVQKMVYHLLTIEDKAERNEQAKIVIATMANIHPHTKRDPQEFRNMLYDHLFVISGFQLDIDCEFERPTPERYSPKPQKVNYTQQGIVRKQYGTIIPKMARELARIEDEEARGEAAKNLARFMRQKSYDYNGEYPSDELIIADLFDMSNGAVQLDVSVFNGSHINTKSSNDNKGGNRQGGNKNYQRQRGGGKQRKQQH